MKTMILSDLLTMRSTLLQLLGTCVIVGAFICYAMKSVVGGMTAIAAMLPFMYLFSLAALDEQNGWERFRLALPTSRRHVVFGRYASLFLVAVATTLFAVALGLAISGVSGVIANGQTDTTWAALSFAENSPFVLLGSACLGVLVIFVGAAVALPLIARFGMTRAVRLAPFVVIIVLSIGIGFFGDSIPLIGSLSEIDIWVATGAYDKVALMFGGVTVVVLVLYIASALLAAKLYEHREF